MAATPFMLKYEAVVTNLATGVFFVVGAYGEKPLIQEAAEQRLGAPYPAGADVTRFFQLFTILWAAYFFLKSALYLWFAATMSLTQAMAARSLVGSLSLAAMTGFSIALGPRLFFLCQKWGLLPSPDEETKAARLKARTAEAASLDGAAAPGSLP